MQSNKIDAGTFSKMFLSGARRLEAEKEIINELNVFPVPDGDTGTNMSLTIMSAVGEVENISDMNMATLSKAISSGSLRGARGNSGVILSQLFRGFTKVIKDKDELDMDIFTQALQKAVETAYKAVMKPKEGTILTVAKGVAEKAQEINGSADDFDAFFKEIIFYGEDVLKRTPDMLPVLKEAGVVDSGGQGLIEILKGGYAAYSGEDVDEIFVNSKPEGVVVAEKEKIITYETSLVIMKNKSFEEEDLVTIREYTDAYGAGSDVSVLGDKITLCVYTDEPGRIISKCLSFGTIDDVVIKPRDKDEVGNELAKPDRDKDMAKTSDVKEAESESNTAPANDNNKSPEPEPEKPVFSEPEKDMGFVAVSCGKGLDEIFTSLGVDYLITGGQTMNPSTDDMINAINKVNAKTVFILPNNKNIILAANQAQYLVEDKEIIVIPTKTIPQGITALITYMNDCTASDNEIAMNDAIRNVKTGQVTYAVRDTSINGIDIQKGNIMGIGDHEILAVGNVVEDTAMDMLVRMVDDESEVISIYYGDEVDEEIANDFAAEVEKKYPDLSVELHLGGQPIYYYIISVE